MQWEPERRFPAKTLSLQLGRSQALSASCCVRVYHDHCRKLGTREGDEALRDYEFGRGAYYASLLERGVGGAWQLWSAGTPVSEPMPAQIVERLATEMEGASRCLRHLAASREAT